MTENGKKISSELQDRLDDLFAEPDGETGPDPVGEPPDADMLAVDDFQVDDGPPPDSDLSAPTSVDSPLLDLNATILSLDWEITDATLTRLISEIDRLKRVYQNEKLPFMFLQLLGSIGKYISVKKVKAHPDSIKMLHSVYAGFEKVLLDDDISDLDKKKILSTEVRQFKSLKQRIRSTSAAPDTAARIPDAISPVALSASPDTPPASEYTPATAVSGELVSLENLLTEVRRVIRDEFAAFKTELRAMLGED